MSRTLKEAQTAPTASPIDAIQPTAKTFGIVDFLLIGAAIVPFVLTTVLIFRYAVNVPYWDQWDFVPTLAKFREGGLTFPDLWAQHNEHRIVVPRVFMLVEAVTTKWNIKLAIYLNLAIALATFTMLLSLLRNTFSADRRTMLSLAVLFSWIYFSPVQWENWLWAWQVSWFLQMFALVGSVYLLARPPIESPSFWRVAGASVLAIVGTYSLLSGAFIWIACLPIFFRRPLTKYAPVWVAAGITSVSPYFVSYVRPPGHPTLDIWYYKPKEFIEYAMTFIGSPISAPSAAPVEAGVVLVALFYISLVLLLLRRELLPSAAPWLALGTYVLINAAGTGVGRVGFGPQHATASRYTTGALVFALAVVVMSALAIKALFGWSRLPAMLLLTATLLGGGFLVRSVGDSYSYGLSQMRSHYVLMTETSKCFERVTREDDPCLIPTFGDPRVAFERAKLLREWGWTDLG